MLCLFHVPSNLCWDLVGFEVRENQAFRFSGESYSSESCNRYLYQSVLDPAIMALCIVCKA